MSNIQGRECSRHRKWSTSARHVGEGHGHDGGASGASGRVNEVNEVRVVREEKIERRNVFDEESMDVSMVRYGKKEYVLLFLPLYFLFALLSNSFLTL